jgi:hypothetical protein
MKRIIVVSAFACVSATVLGGCLPADPTFEGAGGSGPGTGGMMTTGGGGGTTTTGGAPGSGGLSSGGSPGSGGQATGGAASGGRFGGSGGTTMDAGTDGGTGGRDGGATDGGATGGRGGSGVSGTGGAGGTVAAVCTSKVMWTNGNGATMRPGAACRQCHSFTISGTVYPTLHEPLNCNGANGSTGIRVVITGANGTTLTLTPSATGNFYSNSNVSAPFIAKVTNSAGASRAMTATQTSGDCNSCHSQKGSNSAPGRIMTP